MVPATRVRTLLCADSMPATRVRTLLCADSPPATRVRVHTDAQTACRLPREEYTSMRRQPAGYPGKRHPDAQTASRHARGWDIRLYTVPTPWDAVQRFLGPSRQTFVGVADLEHHAVPTLRGPCTAVCTPPRVDHLTVLRVVRQAEGRCYFVLLSSPKSEMMRKVYCQGLQEQEKEREESTPSCLPVNARSLIRQCEDRHRRK